MDRVKAKEPWKFGRRPAYKLPASPGDSRTFLELCSRNDPEASYLVTSLKGAQSEFEALEAAGKSAHPAASPTFRRPKNYLDKAGSFLKLARLTAINIGWN